MGPRILSPEILKSKRSDRTEQIEIPYRVAGETHTVVKDVKNGEMAVPVLSKPLGELITTDSGMEELMEKVVLDVEMGREEVPVLYESIYDRIEDPNFPKVLDAKWALEGLVVFLERLEGGNVKMGTISAEEGPTARIQSFAAGFEYTEEMILYDHTFEMEVLNKAFGEAYNALLNHIHLYPIISATLTGDNLTESSSVATDDDPYAIQVKETLKQGMEDAALDRRPANTLIASRVKQNVIEESMERMLYNGTEYSGIGGIDNIIYYDGWETTVGKKTYTYSGVGANDAYLVRPRRGFKELVKRDLMIDGQPGPIQRLVEEQLVGRCYRGVFAAVEENVQKIDITEQTSG